MSFEGGQDPEGDVVPYMEVRITICILRGKDYKNFKISMKANFKLLLIISCYEPCIGIFVFVKYLNLELFSYR